MSFKVSWAYILFYVFAFSCAENQYAAYVDLLKKSEESRYLRISTIPVDGDKSTDISDPIRVTFSKEPREESLIQPGNVALSIVNPSGTKVSIALQLKSLEKITESSWEGIFFPSSGDNLEYGSDYELYISSKVIAVDDYPIKNDMVVKFTTYTYVEPLRVIRSVPPDRSISVDPYTDIEVHFSGPVDLSALLSDLSISSGAVELSIDEEATREATEKANVTKKSDSEETSKSARSVVYRVVIVLKEGSEFALTSDSRIFIPATAVMRFGVDRLLDGSIRHGRDTVSEDVETLFTIAAVSSKTPPAVSSIFPQQASEEVPLRAFLSVVFTQRVVPESVYSAMKLYRILDSGEEEEVTENITKGGDGASYTFRVEPNLESDSSYRFSVLGTVYNKRNLKLEEPRSVSFQTSRGFDDRPLQVHATSPENNELVSPPSSIEILFSHYINQDASSLGIVFLKGKFEIDETPSSTDDYIEGELSWPNLATANFQPSKQPLPEGEYTVRVLAEGVEDFRKMHPASDFQAVFRVSNSSDAEKPPRILEESKIENRACDGSFSVKWLVSSIAAHQISFSDKPSFEFSEGIKYPSGGQFQPSTQANVLVRGLLNSVRANHSKGTIPISLIKGVKGGFFKIYYKIRSSNTKNSAVFYESKVKESEIIIGLVAPNFEIDSDAICSGSSIKISWESVPGQIYRGMWGKKEDTSGAIEWEDFSHKTDASKSTAQALLTKDFSFTIKEIHIRIQPSTGSGKSLCSLHVDELAIKKVSVHHQTESPTGLGDVIGCEGDSVKLTWGKFSKDEAGEIFDLEVEVESSSSDAEDGWERKKIGKLNSKLPEQILWPLSLTEVKEGASGASSKKTKWRVRTTNFPCPPSEYAEGDMQIEKPVTAPEVPELDPFCHGKGNVSFTWEEGDYTGQAELLLTFPSGKLIESSLWDMRNRSGKASIVRSKDVSISGVSLTDKGVYLVQLRLSSFEPCEQIAESEPVSLEVLEGSDPPVLNDVASICIPDSNSKARVGLSWSAASGVSGATVFIYPMHSYDWLGNGVSSLTEALEGIDSLESIEEDSGGAGGGVSVELDPGLYAWAFAPKLGKKEKSSGCNYGNVKSEEVFWLTKALPAATDLEVERSAIPAIPDPNRPYRGAIICGDIGAAQTEIKFTWKAMEADVSLEAYDTIRFTVEVDGPSFDGIYGGPGDPPSAEVALSAGSLEGSGVMSLSPGTYSWRVRTIREQSLLGADFPCESVLSSPVFFSLQNTPAAVIITKPAAVGGVHLSAGCQLGAGGVNNGSLEWLGASPPATDKVDRYLLNYDDDGDGTFESTEVIPHVSSPVSPQTLVRRLAGLNRHTWQVTPINGSTGQSGCHGASTEARFESSLALLSPTSLVTAVAGLAGADHLCTVSGSGDADVNLSWTAPAGFAGGAPLPAGAAAPSIRYDIEFDMNGDRVFIDPVSVLDHNATTYTWNTVLAGPDIAFRVRGSYVSTSGSTCYSSWVKKTFSVTETPNALTAPVITPATGALCLSSSGSPIEFAWTRPLTFSGEGVLLAFQTGTSLVVGTGTYGSALASNSDVGGVKEVRVSGAPTSHTLNMDISNTYVGEILWSATAFNTRPDGTFCDSTELQSTAKLTTSKGPNSPLTRPLTPADGDTICFPSSSNLGFIWMAPVNSIGGAGALLNPMNYRIRFDSNRNGIYGETGLDIPELTEAHTAASIAHNATLVGAAAGAASTVFTRSSGRIAWELSSSVTAGGQTCYSSPIFSEFTITTQSAPPVPVIDRGSSSKYVCNTGTARENGDAKEDFKMSWTVQASAAVDGYDIDFDTYLINDLAYDPHDFPTPITTSFGADTLNSQSSIRITQGAITSAPGSVYEHLFPITAGTDFVKAVSNTLADIVADPTLKQTTGGVIVDWRIRAYKTDASSGTVCYSDEAIYSDGAAAGEELIPYYDLDVAPVSFFTDPAKTKATRSDLVCHTGASRNLDFNWYPVRAWENSGNVYWRKTELKDSSGTILADHPADIPSNLYSYSTPSRDFATETAAIPAGAAKQDFFIQSELLGAVLPTDPTSTCKTRKAKESFEFFPLPVLANPNGGGTAPFVTNTVAAGGIGFNHATYWVNLAPGAAPGRDALRLVDPTRSGVLPVGYQDFCYGGMKTSESELVLSWPIAPASAGITGYRVSFSKAKATFNNNWGNFGYSRRPGAIKGSVGRNTGVQVAGRAYYDVLSAAAAGGRASLSLEGSTFSLYPRWSTYYVGYLMHWGAKPYIETPSGEKCFYDDFYAGGIALGIAPGMPRASNSSYTCS